MLNWIKNNWIEKLSAVLITAMLMGYVEFVTNPVTKRAFSVPLEYEGEPFNAQVRNRAKLITVYISGERGKVDTVQPGEIHASVSLKDAVMGLNVLPIHTRLSEAASGLTAEPEKKTETVDLSRHLIKEYPIKLIMAGDLPESYSFSGAPQLIPSTCKVSGWKDQIEKIKGVYVRIDLSKMTGDVDNYLPIAAFDTHEVPVISTQIKLSPDQARVKIALIPLPVSKSVYVDVPTTGQPGFSYHIDGISWDPKQVTLDGDSAILGNTDVVHTEPISLNNLTETHNYTSRIILPKGLIIHGSRTVHINVKVRKDMTSPTLPR